MQGRMNSGWKTLAWCGDALVGDVHMRVSAAGRRRTLDLGVRCVHAFVEGSLLGWSDVTLRAPGQGMDLPPAHMPLHPPACGQIRYSPWEGEHFTHDGLAVQSARIVRMSEGQHVFMVAPSDV